MKIRKRDIYICISISGVVGLGVSLYLLLSNDHQPFPDSYIYGAIAFFTSEIYHCAKIARDETKKAGNDNEQ